MLIRPHPEDLRIIAFYIGKVVFGLGLLQLLPLVVALVQREWNDVTALTIGASLAIVVGRLTEISLFTRRQLDWSHGLVTVAVAWLVGPLLYAVPMFLSGHFGSFTDAFFDAMSGLTTSGLALIQDLDHLSSPMQLLRHLSHFAGGQGIVIVVLSVFASSAAHVHTLYVGEGREERIVPNVVRTARFIFTVAFAYAVVGTVALYLAGMHAGLRPARALFHAVNIFMAGFDTGGFAPYSTSIAYYHSPVFEAVVVVLMVAGTLSFGMHYALWRGRRSEVVRSLEVRSLALTLLLTTALVLLGLGRAGVYTDVEGLFRKGLFTVVSAHTGTGFAVSQSPLFASAWGLIAPAAVVVAMALGGMASSTAGGMKAIRIGLAAKSVMRDIRRVIAPDSAVVVASYHQKVRRVVTDAEVRAAITIIVLFLMSYLGGAIVAVFYGFPFDQAMFESTSAGANVGLSIGVLSPDNPAPLKWTFIVQMYVGRLEFMSVFALLGYGVAMVRGRL
jgi:trk system potassium uptake protein TrkH